MKHVYNITANNYMSSPQAVISYLIILINAQI